jgi:tetratricopeptide (TPR) repeat protein
MDTEQQGILHQCTTAWREGRREECERLLAGRDTRDLRDPGLHLAWADFLEELGKTDEHLQELHLAVRDDPGNRELYARLAEVYLDQGRADRAARCWAACIKQRPGDAEPYQQLAQLFKESGDYPHALQTLQEGQAKTQDVGFAPLIRELQAATATASDSTPEPSAASDQIIPGQHHLVTFTSLFSGREGVYARQWLSPTGEGGYTPVHEPLTLKVAENHILGNHTVGVYPVRMDNTVNFIAFDLDLAKFAVNKTITNQKAWNQAMQQLHGVACRLLDLGAAHDLPGYLEDSGFKGRHVWFFLETPVPAGIAKKCGDLLCSQLGAIPPGVVIEVFPKQARVNPGSLGNLIKLPLGYHKRTGRRARFLQPSGELIADQLEFLQTVVRVKRRAVYALIQRLVEAGRPATAPPPETAPHPADDDDLPWDAAPSAPAGSAPAVPAEEYDLERDLEVQVILSRCGTIRALLEKVNQTASLTKEETLVLIHTLGHLAKGPLAVNQLLQRCRYVEPSLFLKSPLRGNPVSCPKIRSRVPHITSTVACNCAFDPQINLYPTPLIHVYSMRRKPTAHPLGLPLSTLHFQNLLQEYLKVRRQIDEATLALKHLEGQLRQVFAEAGVTSLRTALGELQLIKREDGQEAFVLNF